MARPDRHRSDLVSAMRKMLRRRGYAATALTDLLEEAGATNGSLYHHFPGGKEELAGEALRRSAAEIEAALRFVLDDARGPVDAIQTWLDLAIAALRADPRDGCPITPTAIEAVFFSDELRRAASDAFAGWADALEASLAKTRSGETARDQARTVLAAVEGALLLDRTAQTTDHLEALRRAVPQLLGVPESHP